MIGLLMITHNTVGMAYQTVAQHFFNEVPANMRILGIHHDEDTEQIRNRIADAIKNLNTPGGVLILTDIFGATPCNIARKLLNDKVLMITGLNVPMMIKVLQYAQNRSDIAQFAREVRDAAVEGILLVEDGDCGC